MRFGSSFAPINLDAADRTIAEILSAIRGLGFISQSVAIDFADFVCGQDQPDVNHAWRFPTCYGTVSPGARRRTTANPGANFGAISRVFEQHDEDWPIIGARAAARRTICSKLLQLSNSNPFVFVKRGFLVATVVELGGAG